MFKFKYFKWIHLDKGQWHLFGKRHKSDNFGLLGSITQTHYEPPLQKPFKQWETMLTGFRKVGTNSKKLRQQVMKELK